MTQIYILSQNSRKTFEAINQKWHPQGEGFIIFETVTDLILVTDSTLIISLDFFHPKKKKTSITICNLSNKTFPVSSIDHDYSFSIT